MLAVLNTASQEEEDDEVVDVLPQLKLVDNNTSFSLQ
jgi:hypothetical protein